MMVTDDDDEPNW